MDMKCNYKREKEKHRVIVDVHVMNPAWSIQHSVIF